MTTAALAYARNSSNKHRSIARQAKENRAAAEAHGWTLAADAELSDGTSASRYARKARANWAELVRLLPTVGVVILWDATRGDRTLSSWIAFLEDCRDLGVRIHATGHNRTYDPRVAQDYRDLAADGVNAGFMTDELSAKMLSAYAEQAQNGRPHSQTTYGFQRVYDPSSGELVEQREHPEHAPVVREIVRRIGAGDAVSAVARDLTARDVPTPLGAAKWSTQTVASIAKNKAYIGVRVHQVKRAGQTQEYPACWPALVTEAEHYAAVRVLSAPQRRTTHRPRDGKATTLLGNLITCGTCGKKLAVKRVRGVDVYRCCPTVPMAEADELVTALVVYRLSDPIVYRQLRHASDGDDRAAVDARAEADRLAGELDGWRQSAIRGETTPASLAAIEAGLSARITEARRRAEGASIPPVIRALVDPAGDVRERFETAPLGARRDVVRTLLQITARAAGRGRDITERIEITWRTS
jgi:site-specific DNA recombinase